MDIKVIQTGFLQVNSIIVSLDKYCFVVDPCACALSNDENVLIDYIEKNELTCIAILLTHGHFDHVMGLMPLKQKYPNAKIFISEADKDSIGKNSLQMQRKFFENFGELPSEFVEVFSSICSYDFLFEKLVVSDNGEIGNARLASKSCNGEFGTLEGSALSRFETTVLDELLNWTVIETPGHTKGSVCFYNKKEKVLISGDTVFYGTYGRTDLFGGSESEILDSIKKLKSLVEGDCLVYPGHDRYGFKFCEIGL